jgi:sugar phosphate isomerase/epimerase
VGSLAEDTVRNRRCPGEGSFDLVGFLLLARDAGVSVPVSVEVMATDHFALPVGEAARRAYGSTRRLIERAWH